MKRDIILLFFVCSVFSLTGCNRELYDDNPDHIVSIDFTVGSMLKALATPAEEEIIKIILYAVNEQDVVEDKLEINVITKPVNVQWNISKKIKSIYAIANPTSVMESLNPTSVTTLTNLTFEIPAAPPSHFLMSGISNVSGASVNIQLIRLVAKIEIQCSDSDFKNASLEVKNTPKSVYVFARTPVTLPSPIQREIYTFSNISFPYSVYVAENNTATRTEFQVTGQYKGDNITPYPFNISSGSSNINIERNTCYPVGISFLQE